MTYNVVLFVKNMTNSKSLQQLGTGLDHSSSSSPKKLTTMRVLYYWQRWTTSWTLYYFVGRSYKCHRIETLPIIKYIWSSPYIYSTIHYFQKTYITTCSIQGERRLFHFYRILIYFLKGNFQYRMAQRFWMQWNYLYVFNTNQRWITQLNTRPYSYPYSPRLVHIC